MTDGGVDQLRRDPHPPTGLADAPLEHVANTEIPTDLLNADRLALVGQD
jgi:hypothetical protein